MRNFYFQATDYMPEDEKISSISSKPWTKNTKQERRLQTYIVSILQNVTALSIYSERLLCNLINLNSSDNGILKLD